MISAVFEPRRRKFRTSSVNPAVSHPPGFGRRLLTFQGLYLVVGVALFAIFSITNWSHTDFLGVFVYTFVTGNLTTLAMTRLAPLFLSRKPLYHWLVYISCLFVTGLLSSVLGVLIIMIMFLRRTTPPVECGLLLADRLARRSIVFRFWFFDFPAPTL